MRVWNRCKVFIAAVAAALAVPAVAQPMDLGIDESEDFSHQWTAMVFPTRIEGFERLRITQYEERQSNISATYQDPENLDLLSLFIYRPIEPDPSIWFDRALQKIGVREDYFGEVDLDQIALSGFVPSGGKVKSGRYAVLVANGRYNSTAVAIYRSGDWMVKVRISSPEKSVRQLETLTREVLAGLPALAEVGDQPAYPIKPCAEPLAFSQSLAVQHPKDDAALALEVGVMAMAQTIKLPIGTTLGDLRQGAPGAQTTFCRQTKRLSEYSVYRPEGSQDRYIVAFQDAGVSLSVFPDTMKLESKEQEIYRIQSGSSVLIKVYRPYIGLPNYGDLNYVRNTEGPIATVSRPLGEKGSEITLLVRPEDEPDPTEQPN